MKTHTLNTQKSINQEPLCERKFLPLSSLQLWLQVLGRFMRVRMNRFNNLFVRAVRDRLAGLSALLLSLTSRITRRLCVGFGLMGVVAPLSACTYMLFDWRVDKVPGWYHDNYFHFFLLLSPYLFVLSCLAGVWFLFEYRSPKAYALALPAGYTIGKLLWLTGVTSDAEFYSVVPISFVLIGALISVCLFILSDWLVHSFFHRHKAFEKRLGTLYNGLELLDGDTFKEQYRKFYEEKKEFQKQF